MDIYQQESFDKTKDMINNNVLDEKKQSIWKRMKQVSKHALGVAAIMTMPACEAFKEDILPSCTHINEIKKTSTPTNNQWCYIPWTVETLRICTESDCLAWTYIIEMSYLDHQQHVLTKRFLTSSFSWCLDVTTQVVPYDFCARTLRVKITDADGRVIAEEYISP
jgi:hypothetical protein